MNGEHLRAFLWLRWRLRLNQLKRAGTANAIVVAILAVGALLFALLAFVALFFVGRTALAAAAPPIILLVWDGVVTLFVFFWLAGLIADLQRSESLSLEKFLHLPVSLSGVFLINYLSSLLSVNLVIFVPAMLGLSAGLVLARGPELAWLFPLVVAFLLMITALTYQFQGWLAALMVNPRRRRTVIVLLTASFILLSQLPNLLNLFRPWEKEQQERRQAVSHVTERRAELDRAHAEGKIDERQYLEKLQDLHREAKDRAAASEQMSLHQVEDAARLASFILPPGWLAVGAMSVAQGDSMPALLATAGMTLIGAASLWRAYHTTVRLYTGQFTGGKRAAAVAQTPSVGKAADHLLERALPFVSEHASVIALATFRGLLRAPESKMMLLTPFILMVIFGSTIATRPADMGDAARALLAFGAMAMVLLGMVQLIGNQFGFDRNGFRVFVLCPARRQDILLGKNLAFAPLALIPGLIMLALVQALRPMRLDYFLAALPQFVSMYLICCMIGNWQSILAPMHIAAGSLKPSHPKMLLMLIQLGFVLLLSVLLAVTLLPLGISLLVGLIAGSFPLPLCFLLSTAECVLIALLYWLFLPLQGDTLQAREVRILESVVSRTE
jgi:hypothetical protein